MKRFGKLAIGALMAGGAALAVSTPAAARTHIGISFGFGYPGYASFGPCDYYDYYDAPPPWGLPPGYCDYDVYFQPIFWDGEWYRGPVYYRWEDGRRVFWLNGRWRRAEWRHHPYNIEWRERGRDHFRHHRGYEHGSYYHHNDYYRHDRRHEYRGNRYENHHGGYQHTRFNHDEHSGSRHETRQESGHHHGRHGDHHGDHNGDNNNDHHHHGHS